ncbi:VWA domain-containing protein [Nocardia blacklockiae]|nr:VWA domain-containing protein [Nocardia blacklockiae]MBF6171887.1 VWA domain-containing protein [Nocardia blacklockiae]
MAKIIGVIAAGVIGVLPAAAPATAQQSPGAAPAYAPTMLVLDASGSMLATDPGGGTKMDAAKEAVRAFVTAAPAASKVGLSVYGTGTGSADAEKSAGCRDVQVLRAPDALDKSALTRAVDGITPSGYTPIGAALRTAAQALPSSGPRSIVLVSDGIDTCAPPDPCEVARELSRQGNRIMVHAIGFGVDEAARAQLSCVAQTTGGTYTDAADGKILEQVLPRVSATALRNYTPAGVRIEGTPAYRDAPVAAPGQYLDTLGRKTPRYYAVDVPDGATAYFSGTVSFPRGGDSTFANNSLAVRVYGAEGQDCHAYESEQATRSSDGVTLTVAKAWKGATEPKTGGGQDNCKGGGRYYFSLEWARVADNAPETLSLEMNVGVEPKVSDSGAPAATAEAAFHDPGGAATPVSGGGSFNVAAPLAGSGKYSDTLQRGEFVFYRVKLEWGQGLAYRVRYAATPEHGVEYISNVNTTLYAPYRKEITSDTTSYTGQETVLPSNKPALATAPVRYANRTADDSKIRDAALSGWYYIAVALGPPIHDEGKAGPVPVQLEVDVTGTAESGPPSAYPAADPNDGAGFEKPTPGGASATATDDVSQVWLLITAFGAGVVVVILVVVVVLVRRTRQP